MNKKFLISVVVIFAVSFGLGSLIHECLLSADYAKVSHLFRAKEDIGAHMVYLMAGYLLFSLAFVWIYGRGKEAKPFLVQGVRYGIAMAILIVFPLYLTNFAVQPIDCSLVTKQIAFESMGTVILGVVVAWLNK